MTKLPSNVWVVIPAYNESKYLATVLEKVAPFTSNCIVVDDGSRDKTAEIARKHTKYVLNHQVNLGKGAALTTGCEFAFYHQQAEAVILLDSDDQHDPNEMPLFLKKLATRPMVFGVRAFTTMPRVRVVGNKMLSTLVAILFGKYIPDILSGYKAFNRDAYEQIKWASSGYDVELEIAVRVARHKVAYNVQAIKTIYHDLERGMTLLDALGIITRILSWRIAL
jgi:glycosyltransferase involved in cell wall biosynthesis